MSVDSKEEIVKRLQLARNEADSFADDVRRATECQCEAQALVDYLEKLLAIKNRVER